LPFKTIDLPLFDRLKFVKAPTSEQGANLPPSMGLQFFGLVDIDGQTGQVTVHLMDRDDTGSTKSPATPPVAARCWRAATAASPVLSRVYRIANR